MAIDCRSCRGRRAARAELFATVIPGWQYGSDLGPLSQSQAADVIGYLGERSSDA